MQIVVLSSAALAYIFVLLLFRRRAGETERLERRIGAVAKIGSAQAAEGSELSRPFAERFLRPALQGAFHWVVSVMPRTENPRLALNLRQAGYSLRTGEYNALRLVFALGGGLAGAFLGLLAGSSILSSLLGQAGGGSAQSAVLSALAGSSVTGALLGLPLGVAAALILLRFQLKSAITKRKQLIQRQLPEVLDLLSVSVEAGLGFDAAMQRITERARGPLILEISAACRETALGRSRSEALRNLEAHCGIEEMKSFVGAVLQAEQLGISMKNVLRSQAQQMRLVKRQRVEEKAMKAPVKMILPLVAFVFPVLFIILLGPSVISILGMTGVFG